MMRQNFGYWVKGFTGVLDFHLYALFSLKTVKSRNEKTKQQQQQKNKAEMTMNINRLHQHWKGYNLQKARVAWLPIAMTTLLRVYPK